MPCPVPIGEWLIFGPATCFGSSKPHTGMIVAASNEELIAIPINATSQIKNVKQFAIDRGLNPSTSVVEVPPKSPEASHHFSKPTAFDCNRVRRFSYRQLEIWYKAGKIKPIAYNNSVHPDLLQRIKDGINASPLIDEHTKSIVRDS